MLGNKSAITESQKEYTCLLEHLTDSIFIKIIVIAARFPLLIYSSEAKTPLPPQHGNPLNITSLSDRQVNPTLCLITFQFPLLVSS